MGRGIDERVDGWMDEEVEEWMDQCLPESVTT